MCAHEVLGFMHFDQLTQPSFRISTIIHFSITISMSRVLACTRSPSECSSINLTAAAPSGCVIRETSLSILAQTPTQSLSTFKLATEIGVKVAMMWHKCSS